MTDDTAARLRALAERLNTTRVTHHQVSRDWEPYETATKTHPVEHIKAEAADAILALLDERDAAVALLRECREVLRDWTGPSTDYRAAMMALNRAVARIDALLGGGKGA